MSREVRVDIGSDGKIKVEFLGFPGDSCFDEAEMLAGILKELGLWAVPVEVTPKTSEEIAREIAKSESIEGKKVPHF
jgi:hypothetical protein